MSVKSLQTAEFGYRLFLIPFFYVLIGPIIGSLAFIPFLVDKDEMMGKTFFVVALTCIVALIYAAANKGSATNKWVKLGFKLALVFGVILFAFCIVWAFIFGAVTIVIAFGTGGIPAFLTGVATALARGLNTPKWSMIIVSTLAGAFTTGIWLWLQPKLEWSFHLQWSHVLIGTFAGLVCAVLAERVGLLDPYGSRTSTRMSEVPSP